ncbi:hypothetical protein PMAYCL1PPCAC_27887, partial [Pristionchus mayeri]
IKEEPSEFKEEPVDDYHAIKQEEPFLNATDTFNENESMDIKDELVEVFNDVKHEEPIPDIGILNTIDEMKEEPGDFKNKPVFDLDDKQEERIIDIPCPSQTFRPPDQSTEKFKKEVPSKTKASMEARLCNSH